MGQTLSLSIIPSLHIPIPPFIPLSILFLSMALFLSLSPFLSLFVSFFISLQLFLSVSPSHCALFVSLSVSPCFSPSLHQPLRVTLFLPLSSSASPCHDVSPCSSECDCSGRSEECVFDMEQYRSSGHGGRCLNCRDNTQGPHCERCRENHYRASPQDPCLPCDCNGDGKVLMFHNYYPKCVHVLLNTAQCWFTH